MSSLISLATALHSLHQNPAISSSLQAIVPLALIEGVPEEWTPHLRECVPTPSEACRCFVFERPTLTDEWEYVKVSTC